MKLMWNAKNCKNWTEKTWVTILRNPLADILPVPKQAVHSEHYPSLVLEGFRQHHHQRMTLLERMPLGDNPMSFFNSLMHIEPRASVLTSLLNKITEVTPQHIEQVFDMAVWLNIQYPELFDVATAWCGRHIKDKDVCGSKALATAISIDDLTLVKKLAACYQNRLVWDKALSACFSANNIAATRWLFETWTQSHFDQQQIVEVSWKVLAACKTSTNDAMALWMELIAPWSDAFMDTHMGQNGFIPLNIGEDELRVVRTPEAGDGSLARILWLYDDRAPLFLRSIARHLVLETHFINMTSMGAYVQAACLFPLLSHQDIQQAAQNISSTTVDQLAPWPDIKSRLSAQMLCIHTDASAHQLPQRRRVM